MNFLQLRATETLVRLLHAVPALRLYLFLFRWLRKYLKSLVIKNIQVYTHRFLIVEKAELMAVVGQ